MELVESDGQYIPAEEYSYKVNSFIVQILLMRGIDMLMMARLEEHIKAAGFMDIEKMELKLPCGKWGGKLGELQLYNYTSLLSALSGMMIAKGLLTKEVFDDLMANWGDELNRLRSCVMVFYYVGRKP